MKTKVKHTILVFTCFCLSSRNIYLNKKIVFYQVEGYHTTGTKYKYFKEIFISDKTTNQGLHTRYYSKFTL